VSPRGATLGPLVKRARYNARKTLNRIDNEPVRQARHLLKRLRNDPPDVLFLGDSAISFIDQRDTDRRRLYTMVDDALGPDVSMHVVHGASFNHDIYDAYLHLLEATPHRPVLIVPNAIRIRFMPWLVHPVHSHRRALQKIRSIDPHGAAWKVHGSWPGPTQAEFDEFLKVPYPTLLGDWTVADYVVPLTSTTSTIDAKERTRLLYGYHNGGLLTAGGPELDGVTRMGKTIRDLGLTAVVYQVPVPVITGREILGQEYFDRVVHNFAVLDEAYRIGAGEDAEIIQAGVVFGPDEFIDPSDGVEHFNQAGRTRLSAMIVDGYKRATGKG
jgi:hypothetical protein